MFLINLSGKESIFEQIRNQIIRFIQIGVLAEGEKLPSVRQLANEIGINPNTVARAYQKLEEEGYIYTIQKKGVYVAKKGNLDELDFLASSTIAALKEKGVDKERLTKVIAEIYGEDQDAGN